MILARFDAFQGAVLCPTVGIVHSTIFDENCPGFDKTRLKLRARTTFAEIPRDVPMPSRRRALAGGVDTTIAFGGCASRSTPVLARRKEDVLWTDADGAVFPHRVALGKP